MCYKLIVILCLGDKNDKVKCKVVDEAIEDIRPASNVLISPTSSNDKSFDVMNTEEQPATLTCEESKAAQSVDVLHSVSECKV